MKARHGGKERKLGMKARHESWAWRRDMKDDTQNGMKARHEWTLSLVSDVG